MPLNIGCIGVGRLGSTLAHHLSFARRDNSGGLIAGTHSVDAARPVSVAEVGA
jgi:hypothetical protein